MRRWEGDHSASSAARRCSYGRRNGGVPPPRNRPARVMPVRQGRSSAKPKRVCRELRRDAAVTDTCDETPKLHIPLHGSERKGRNDRMLLTTASAGVDRLATSQPRVRDGLIIFLLRNPQIDGPLDSPQPQHDRCRNRLRQALCCSAPGGGTFSRRCVCQTA